MSENRKSLKMEIKPVLQSWENIDWSDAQLLQIYRDWSAFLARAARPRTANTYIAKALEIDGENVEALYAKSKTERSLARLENALEDGMAASRIDDTKDYIELEVAQALYELNRFEDCAVKLHDDKRKFIGNRTKPFITALETLDMNFHDSLGPNLSYFTNHNMTPIKLSAEKTRLKRIVDHRPLWKKLREEGKCDVESVVEEEVELLCPREIARRERFSKIFLQRYLGNTWKDVLFMKSLRHNQKNIFLPKSLTTTTRLEELVNGGYDAVQKFVKMLHARSPWYNETRRMCPSREWCQRRRDAYLNGVQYRTRLVMLSALGSVRDLRASGHLNRLTEFVEEIMGDFVVKTHRVTPWKFEFMNDMYNTLALAFLDKFVLPPLLTDITATQQLSLLLRLPQTRKEKNLSFVFGPKSSVERDDASDVADRKYFDRLEKRMACAKYPLERAYLYHEMARRHLNNFRLQECQSAARKADEEAQICNSIIWQLLAKIMICKVHALIQRMRALWDTLAQALVLAKRLGSEKTCWVLEICISLEQIIGKEIQVFQSSKSISKRMQSRFTSQKSSISTTKSSSLNHKIK